jgi:ribose transport system substrate-binding protein
MKRSPLWWILGLTVAMAGVVTLVYRGSWGAASGGALPRVVLIVKTRESSISFWNTLRDGAKRAANDLGLDLAIKGPRDEQQVDEQISLLAATVGEAPAAIVLAAADFERLIPGIRAARQAGIPVVTVDSFVSSNDANTKIGTDNLTLGKKAAEAILRHVRAGSEVGVINYIRESSTGRDRESGLVSGLTGRVVLLPTLYCGADADVAYRQAKDLLLAHPRLGGLVALNEPTSEGVSRALAEAGKSSEVALVAVDQSFELVKRLEDGTIRDLLVQQPFNMGYLGVQAAKDLIDRHRVEAAIDTGSVDIDLKTLFQPRNQKLLFPFSEN